MHLNELARVIKIIGDERRLAILCILFEQKDCCVSAIAKKMNMSIAIVSHHLQILLEQGIVKYTRDGKMVCYAVSKKPIVNDLKKFICKYK